jgi:hypothetical protein
MHDRKAHILSEIRRTAALNGGVPLGMDRFASDTGIREREWRGVLWARWSDAIREAGFRPNRLKSATDADHLMHQYAQLVRELGRLPIEAELQLRRRTNPSFPSVKPFRNLGSSSDRVKRLSAWCRRRDGFKDVLNLCDEWLKAAPADEASRSADTATPGFVYLLKHGTRREYKIGRTFNALRREGEIGIELPEKVSPVHMIKTDDPAGVEAYWHQRFSEKRKNGEWFALDPSDVAAFRKWKRIW